MVIALKMELSSQVQIHDECVLYIESLDKQRKPRRYIKM